MTNQEPNSRTASHFMLYRASLPFAPASIYPAPFTRLLHCNNVPRRATDADSPARSALQRGMLCSILRQSSQATAASELEPAVRRQCSIEHRTTNDERQRNDEKRTTKERRTTNDERIFRFTTLYVCTLRCCSLHCWGFDGEFVDGFMERMQVCSLWSAESFVVRSFRACFLAS